MKCRTLTGFGVYPNPAAVSLNDPLTNRQPHPCAGVGPARVMKAFEEVKHFGLILRFYADAIVGDRKAPLATILGG